MWKATGQNMSVKSGPAANTRRRKISDKTNICKMADDQSDTYEVRSKGVTEEDMSYVSKVLHTPIRKVHQREYSEQSEDIMNVKLTPMASVNANSRRSVGDIVDRYEKLSPHCTPEQTKRSINGQGCKVVHQKESEAIGERDQEVQLNMSAARQRHDSHVRSQSVRENDRSWSISASEREEWGEQRQLYHGNTWSQTTQSTDDSSESEQGEGPDVTTTKEQQRQREETVRARKQEEEEKPILKYKQ